MVGDTDSPVDLKYFTNPALMEMLEESQVVAIKDPGLRANQEGSEHNSSVDLDFRVFLQIVIIPDML